MIKVSLISLGCAKNLVDSEIMIGHLHQAGMVVIPEAEKADVVIVNTCSFIDSSKEESIGHILEVHQNRGMKKRRKEQKLIVAGCMSQRFSKDLSSSLNDEDLHPGFQHPSFPAHSETHRLRQDRRGLQPSLHVLHHPADPGPPSQSHRRERRRRGAAARQRRRERA
jgi:tRNA A37 methylthiotransferase MiaB